MPKVDANSLLDAVKAVPMRCADCGETTKTTWRACPDSDGEHTFETDDAAIVRAVRVWWWKREPSRESVAAEITSENPYDEADAVRALYRRAWEVKP